MFLRVWQKKASLSSFISIWKRISVSSPIRRNTNPWAVLLLQAQPFPVNSEIQFTSKLPEKSTDSKHTQVLNTEPPPNTKGLPWITVPDFFKNNWTHPFFGEIYSAFFFFFTFISRLMCFSVGRPITGKWKFPAPRLELYFFLQTLLSRQVSKHCWVASPFISLHKELKKSHMTRGEQTGGLRVVIVCVCVCLRTVSSLLICESQSSDLPHLLPHGVGPYSNVSNVQVREFSPGSCVAHGRCWF